MLRPSAAAMGCGAEVVWQMGGRQAPLSFLWRGVACRTAAVLFLRFERREKHEFAAPALRPRKSPSFLS